MSKGREIVSDSLTEEQDRMLTMLLNMIIPPSEDGKKPSATDVGFGMYMVNENLVPWIREGLVNISEEAHRTYNANFLSLDISTQALLIDRLRRKHFHFFTKLTAQLVQCYYQNDRVLKAIGLEARTPFPEGYTLEEGDLTLLEPVYNRGKVYRD